MAGDITRLMIFAPPQAGKSELTSIRFPAYWLANRPDDPVILTSYAASLATTFSRRVRSLVESDAFREAYPRIRTDPEHRTVEHWTLRWNRGALLAAGVGGGITGHGAALGIIDDPYKDWEQAYSESHRKLVWDWYRTVFRTRIWENGAIVMIMCMTGDTPVMMADGTERPLRDVEVGDRVATYDNGTLATSTVLNHRSNGLDRVFAIKTTSGRIVHANARHPFLVEEHGEFKWVRTQDLKLTQKIVTVKDSGVSGRALPVNERGATNPSRHEGIASVTTAKNTIAPVTVAAPNVNNVTHISNTAMALHWPNTRRCLPSKMGSAPSAVAPPILTTPPTSEVGIFLLTTTMTPARLEGCCATTVTSRPATFGQPMSPPRWLNTSDFTTDQIESITPAGTKEVFDLEVAKTGNFIANGLVSHNTRWHTDDLAGRLLRLQSENWTVLRLPAIAEDRDERAAANRLLNQDPTAPDPLGRKPGEPLVPGRFSRETLLDIKRDVGTVGWYAEYQGVPRPPEGSLFKRQWFEIVSTPPAALTRVRYWDKAGTRDGGARTAGVLMGRDRRGVYYVLDVIVGQWSPLEREQVMVQTAKLDGIDVAVWTEQEGGSGGKESAEATVRNLAGFDVHTETVSGSKEIRARPFAAQCEAGNVRLVRGPWNEAYIEELLSFPGGRFADQTDASSGAFHKLSAPDAKQTARAWAA